MNTLVDLDCKMIWGRIIALDMDFRPIPSFPRLSRRETLSAGQPNSPRAFVTPSVLRGIHPACRSPFVCVAAGRWASPPGRSCTRFGRSYQQSTTKLDFGIGSRDWPSVTLAVLAVYYSDSTILKLTLEYGTFDGIRGRRHHTLVCLKHVARPDRAVLAHRSFFLQVAQSLNVVWLLSEGSLADPLCLMEVCAAVRQGTPVLPVRLAGGGMRPLNLPIWGLSIAVPPSRPAGRATADPKLNSNSARVTDSALNATDSGRGTGGKHELATRGGNDANATVIETRERTSRLRRRAADGFYAQLAQRLPKPVQVELHRNNFLVKDVIAAVRACLERADQASAGVIVANPGGAGPPVFDLSAQHGDHENVLTALVGANRRQISEKGEAGIVDREEGKEMLSLWNWEQIPRTAPLAGRARVSDAVPWRTEEETLEMIRMEDAEADDLAGEDEKVRR